MSTAPSNTTKQYTPPKPRLPVHVQQSTSPSAIPAATSTLLEAFESDPVSTYMLNHLPPSTRPTALQNLFILSNNATLKAGGELWSASTVSPSSSAPDYQVAAAIFPPGKSLDDLGAGSLALLLLGGGLAPVLWNMGPAWFVSRMNAYDTVTVPTKKATFPNGETFYYILLIGAGHQHRGKGLAPGLIRKLQERAALDRKAIYLEASNEGARKVYDKLGFEEAGECLWLGMGECDKEGEAREGGTGVRMWPMVWRPEGKIMQE